VQNSADDLKTFCSNQRQGHHLKKLHLMASNLIKMKCGSSEWFVKLH
jgi:hypothetical protein